MYWGVSVFVHACVYGVCVHAHVCISVCVCARVCTHVCISVRVCVCLCVCCHSKGHVEHLNVVQMERKFLRSADENRGEREVGGSRESEVMRLMHGPPNYNPSPVVYFFLTASKSTTAQCFGD